MSKPDILVTDDSKTSRMMTIAFIKQTYPDAIIREAGDGLSALNEIVRAKPDLVIMDINMPGMNGLDAAQAAKSDNPDLLIAMLSANVQEASQNKARDIGVHFFRKPINPQVIGQILALLGT